GGGAGANMGEGGDSIGGSDGKGICGGSEDQGDNGDTGGENIARSLTTSESVHAGIGAGCSSSSSSHINLERVVPEERPLHMGPLSS
nr:hypothetical protein [Tanacetum cinerariifolium]